MSAYDYWKKFYDDSNKIPKDENDFILVVDNHYKDKNDDYYPFSERKFVKITKEMISIFKYHGITDSSYLTIALSDKNNSSNYIKYILDLFTTDNSKLKKYINNILVDDYRLKLDEVRFITLSVMEIDKNVIELTKKLFPKIERIKFVSCHIKDNCNFNNINFDFEFDNCDIDSIKSLNYCTKNLDLYNCKLNNISHSIINSKKIFISKIDDETLENLFIFCHFPELTELTIGDFYGGVNDVSYKKALLFLPKACPNLLKLQISGKVYSFDFLSNFNKLSSCEIRSIDDSAYVYEAYSPYVENEKERNLIIKNSKIKPQEEIDEHIAIKQKLDEIIKLLNKLGVSEEEKNLYLNKKVPKILLDPLNAVKLKNLNYYYIYDSTNDELIMTADDTLYDEKNNCACTYKMFNGILYRTFDEKKRGYFAITKKIDLAEQFMYNRVGIPIVFRKSNYEKYKEFEFVKEVSKEEWYINYDPEDESSYEYYDGELEELSDEQWAEIDEFWNTIHPSEDNNQVLEKKLK